MKEIRYYKYFHLDYVVSVNYKTMEYSSVSGYTHGQLIETDPLHDKKVQETISKGVVKEVTNVVELQLLLQGKNTQ